MGHQRSIIAHSLAWPREVHARSTAASAAEQAEPHSPTAHLQPAWAARRFVLFLLVSVIGFGQAGCETEARGSLFGSIEGRVVFQGPVAQAPVELVRLVDGQDAEVMANGVTDENGRYQFRPLVADFGTYRVRADLAGLPWRQGTRTGIYPRGMILSATLPDYDRYGERLLFVSAYTTLADAVAEALRETRDDADERARAGWVAHLAFDPAQTEISDPLADVARDPTRHRLLIDAFDALAGQLSSAAGLDAAYFTPQQVLAALLEDARGTEPPGLFDGLGPAGAVYLEAGITPLDPGALRHHLADALGHLVADDEAWSSVTPAAIAPLVRRLRCSPSSLFPVCDPDSVADTTPPVIDAIDPSPGTSLSGVVDVQVRAHEPDGVLARVDFVLRFDERQAPQVRLAGPGYVFRLDTDAIQGVDRIDADVVVVNGAGLETRRAVSWPLADRNVGQLQGQVHKGRGRRVRVQAFDLASPPLKLSEGLTDEQGRFVLDIVSYAGPIRLAAGDDASATGSERSVYDDEVRGERRWRSDRTLEALVPEFRSSAPPSEPFIITPFTDMALARARRGEAQGELLVNRYEATLTELGDQLGLEARPESLMHTVPAPVDEPAISFEAAERLAFALGCFSAQAETLAQVALPEQPDSFDALDLVALYRLDLEVDPFLDGQTGTARATLTLPEGEVRLPLEPFRQDFVRGCARWLSHPANLTDLPRATLTRHLQRIGAYTNADIYDPAAAPPAFDELPPEVRITLTALEEEEGAAWQGQLPSPDALNHPAFDRSTITTVRGPIEVVIEATDSSGISTLTVVLEEQAAEAISVTEETPGPDTRRLRVRIETDALDETFQKLRVVTSDLLDHEQTRRYLFLVDRTPPVVGLVAPDLNIIGDAIYTNRTEYTEGTLRWQDASHASARVTRDDGELATIEAPGGDNELPFGLDLPTDNEGVTELALTVTDRTGLSTTATFALNIDRTPPTFAILPTSSKDELNLGVDRDLASAPDLPLDETGGTIRRWQTKWGEDTDNPATIAFSLTEPDRPGQSPPELVTLEATLCMLNAQFQCSNAYPTKNLILSAANPVFQVTAGIEGFLPFDPIASPPQPGNFRLSITRVIDAAGNEGLINIVASYRHQVVPLPVEFSVVDTLAPDEAPNDVVVMERFDIVAGDLIDILGRSAAPRKLYLQGYRIGNPHEVAVTVRITPAGHFYFSTVASVVFVDQGIADFSFVPPTCGNGLYDLGAHRFNFGSIDMGSCTFSDAQQRPLMPPFSCSECVAPTLSSRIDPIGHYFDHDFMTIRAETGAGAVELGAEIGTWDARIPPGSTVLILVLGDLARIEPSEVHLGILPGGAASGFLVEQAALFYDRQAGEIAERYRQGAVEAQVRSVSLSTESSTFGLARSVIGSLSGPFIPIAPGNGASSER